MYEHFYGLRELPFELTANPRYLFLTAQHREALSALEYGLSSAKAVTALIGEAGTGKTTLLRAALESDRCRNVTCVYVNNPALTRAEFIETLSARFNLSAAARSSKAVLLDELDHVLRERRQRGQITALVIDEAQTMSDVLLEEIRLLANSETATEKLLPVVLAGQPELGDRLNDPRLRQLKQRVTLRCEIGPLSLNETAAYIAQRIRIAGGDASALFTREAVHVIHDFSGGLPRLINVICDNALLTGCGLGRQPVDRGMVEEVSRDLDLGSLRAATAVLPSATAEAPIATPSKPDTTTSEQERSNAPRMTAMTPRSDDAGTAGPETENDPVAAASGERREMFAAASKRSRIFSFLK
jgi:general secretion pathway protein A